MTFGCTCAAVVHWELAEWAYDQFFMAGDSRRYHDTLLDMALGVLGGALYLGLSATRRPNV